MSANQEKEVNPSSLSMDESVDRTLLVLDTAFSHDDDDVDVDLSDQSTILLASTRSQPTFQNQATKSKSEHHGYEEITVDLSIPNFMGLYNVTKTKGMSRILIEEKFTVGGQNWAFHLHQNKEEDVGVALFFYGAESTLAEYTLSWKSSDGRLTSTGRFGLRQLTEGRAGWGKTGWKSMSQLQKQSDGSLRLKLILTVYSGDESKAFLRMEASKDFNRGLDPAVGVGTDLTFAIKEGSKTVRTIRAHKGILSLRSSVFASKFAWGTNGEIEIISDMSSKAGILLGFIYSSGELDDEWESVAGELLHGANKYELKSLRTFLMAKMNASDLNLASLQIPVFPA